jgi:hypothetical protein
MYEIVLQPLIDELVVPCLAQEIFVIDVDFNVVLTGTTPHDLAPANFPQRLPADLDGTVRQIVKRHAFSGDGVARGETGRRSLRVLRLAGPGVEYYGVVARPHPGTGTAVLA